MTMLGRLASAGLATGLDMVERWELRLERVLLAPMRRWPGD